MPVRRPRRRVHLRAAIRLAAVAATLFSGMTPPARADVVSRSANGFQLRSSVRVATTPQAAYEGAVLGIASWWDPSHTYSGRSDNLSLETRAGGCFCERLEAGGSVQHLTVAYLQPGAAVRLVGGLGPLQELAATGALTWTFAADEGQTRVTWTYRVGGLEPDEVQKLAGLVDQVLTLQLGRLGRFIETGRP